jgi:heptose I phosphotransferase
VLSDGRSFVIVEDLSGFRPADKLLFGHAVTFDRLLEPTADLSARVHSSGLHHRDLYLCHFFTRTDSDSTDLRLIDCARVKRLPGFLTRYRWIVKDLSQFWYSTYKHPEITDADRDAWLRRYAQQAGMANVPRLRRWIDRKVAWIARHDVKLHHAQPHRNISIPT